MSAGKCPTCGAEVDAWGNPTAEEKIADHNKSCDEACYFKQERGDCNDYVIRGLQCHDCPRDWRIE